MKEVLKMKRFVSLFIVIIMVFTCSVCASARLVGDVNSDSKVNSLDALLILRKSVGFNDGANEKYMDANGDGRINSLDALTVLMIAVGSYEGDLEVEDELVTSYKAQIVDPILATGEFTITTEVESEGTVVTAEIMVNGKDMCVNTASKGVTLRMLHLSGKTYLVIPMEMLLSKGIYGEVDKEMDVSIGSPAKVTYIKSERVKVDGVEYIRESYRHADGTVTDYYFKDGKWAMIGAAADGEAGIQKILDFKKGVDESYFSLNGYKEVAFSDITGK